MSDNGNKRIIKVAVSIPNEGKTEPAAYDNRLTFAFHLGMLQCMSHFGLKEYQGVKYDYPENVEFQFFWSTVGGLLTPLARERLTEWALQTNVNLMLQIDDDMILPINMFERLFKHNVDIVAPLAFMRGPPHKPVMFWLEEGYDHMNKKDYYISHTVDNYPKNTLVECDAVGFGAALIKMDVIRKMKKPWFMSTTASGEDVLFCHNAKKVGAKIFMDTSLKLGHLGYSPIITEEDYEREFRVKELREELGDWKGKKKEPVT